jgi:arsenite oxidase large subunit
VTTPYYIPESNVPLPPKDADILSTACDYCIVACGLKVFRWPVAGNRNGGPKAKDNAFGANFPVDPLGPWVAPNQHNIVLHNGEPHHVVIIPDKEAKFVNTDGDSSIRGGAIAQKCYNPQKPTRDRLKSPLMRIYGILQPVPWEFALDVAAEVGKHVIDNHGDNAYGVKTYSYQFIENTYAITKYALRHIATANFTFHDTPSDVSSTPGFRDAGFDNFGPAYEDWMNAETLFICGTDPYETKTILWTQWIMKGIQNGQKTIMMVPRRTAGVAFAEKNGGLWLDVTPGTDLLVINAIARLIVENEWQDKDWIANWVNNKWGSSSGFGQGTRNTPWQWRTTWGKFQRVQARECLPHGRDRPEEDPHRRRVAGQAQWRQASQDLDHDREGPLLVQQHRQYPGDLGPRHHRRRRRPPGTGHRPRRRPPARRPARRQVSA